MTIAHFKVYLRQDSDMMAVREIVEAYEGAKLDDDNYIVYYNAEPRKVEKFAAEMQPFKYSQEIVNEVF